MPTKLKFTFPIATLLQDGDAILHAAEARATALAARVKAPKLTEARRLHAQLTAQVTGQKGVKADVGTLTQAQNDLLATLKEVLGRARETAKLAFKGTRVKLKEEFQVGVTKPSDLGSELARARIVAAACKKTQNLTALAEKGWIDADTTELDGAIAALDTTDDTQEAAKGGGVASTDTRNGTANLLYDAVLAIQNAANLQWPSSKPGNTEVRALFRLDTFPPTPPPGKKPGPPAPPAQ
jgi:hypothetical protein